MKVQKCNNLTFKAGLTRSLKSEINSCNVESVTNFMIKNGINADFKNNKLIAWCCLRCCDFIDSINKKYNMNLGFPNGIIVEDFKKLKVLGEEIMGTTNFAPSRLYKNRDIIIPEKVIFFNSDNIKIEDIDKISDECYSKGITTTDFFLESFLHEFMHILHENNLLTKLGGKKLLEQLKLIQNPEFLSEFQQKYGRLLSNICHYAAIDPIETVACDLSKRTIENMNKETLLPKQNIFNKRPYAKKMFLTKDRETKTNQLLRRFWNGKFD